MVKLAVFRRVAVFVLVRFGSSNTSYELPATADRITDEFRKEQNQNHH